MEKINQDNRDAILIDIKVSIYQSIQIQAKILGHLENKDPAIILKELNNEFRALYEDTLARLPK